MGWDLLGALIITYFTSRAVLLVIPRRTPVILALAHLGSWVLIAAVVGALRINIYTPFDMKAGFVYVIPQIFWLALDLARVLKQTRR